jgi:hypothetical protein
MKTRSNIYGLAAGLALGALTALSAQAGNGTIKVTHSDTPYKGGSQAGSSKVEKAQTTVAQTKAPEVQVGVMANSPAQPQAKRAVFIHR